MDALVSSGADSLLDSACLAENHSELLIEQLLGIKKLQRGLKIEMRFDTVNLLTVRFCNTYFQVALMWSAALDSKRRFVASGIAAVATADAVDLSITNLMAMVHPEGENDSSIRTTHSATKRSLDYSTLENDIRSKVLPASATAGTWFYYRGFILWVLCFIVGGFYFVFVLYTWGTRT